MHGKRAREPCRLGAPAELTRAAQEATAGAHDQERTEQPGAQSAGAWTARRTASPRLQAAQQQRGDAVGQQGQPPPLHRRGERMGADVKQRGIRVHRTVYAVQGATPCVACGSSVQVGAHCAARRTVSRLTSASCIRTPFFAGGCRPRTACWRRRLRSAAYGQCVLHGAEQEGAPGGAAEGRQVCGVRRLAGQAQRLVQHRGAVQVLRQAGQGSPDAWCTGCRNRGARRRAPSSSRRIS